MSLVLGVQFGQEIIINGNIRIIVTKGNRGATQYRMVIDAPKDVKIVRGAKEVKDEANKPKP